MVRLAAIKCMDDAGMTILLAKGVTRLVQMAERNFAVYIALLYIINKI